MALGEIYDLDKNDYFFFFLFLRCKNKHQHRATNKSKQKTTYSYHDLASDSLQLANTHDFTQWSLSSELGVADEQQQLNGIDAFGIETRRLGLCLRFFFVCYCCAAVECYGRWPDSAHIVWIIDAMQRVHITQQNENKNFISHICFVCSFSFQFIWLVPETCDGIEQAAPRQICIFISYWWPFGAVLVCHIFINICAPKRSTQ